VRGDPCRPFSRVGRGLAETQGDEGAAKLDYSDLEVYEKRSLGGGLSFTEESLEKIFSNQFHDIHIRKMKELPESSGMFGKDFLWAIKMEKNNKIFLLKFWRIAFRQ
jgi:hypothetical protein